MARSGLILVGVAAAALLLALACAAPAPVHASSTPFAATSPLGRLVAEVRASAAALAASSPPNVGGVPTPAPTEYVNLDLPPRQRWVAIADKYKPRFVPIMAWLDRLITPDVWKVLDPILAALDDYIPQPFADEIRGMVDRTTDINLTLGKAVLLNLIYDVSAGCTSIVAQRGADGSMFHARNLDYGLPGLRNLTANVEFQRNNVTIFRSVHFIGYVGVLTGVRPNGWSVTVNERDRDGEGTPIDNLIEALKGGQSIGFFLRGQLETSSTYQQAIQALQHTPLMAPVYLTVAGANTGEGMIITRDREKPDDVWHVTAPSMWNIIETNYDHWKPSGDSRLATAMLGMSKLNSNSFTPNDIVNVLGIKPVLNPSTMYTSSMNPRSGELSTLVRFDMGN